MTAGVKGALQNVAKFYQFYTILPSELKVIQHWQTSINHFIISSSQT